MRCSCPECMEIILEPDSFFANWLSEIGDVSFSIEDACTKVL